MTIYHKIQTCYKRNLDSPKKELLIGEWSTPQFKYLQNNNWIWNEKIDGTNIRVLYDNGQISFAGKTDNAQLPGPLVKYLNDTFLSHPILFEDLFKNGLVCFYGEGYGKGIQSGGNYRQDQAFVLFDIKIGPWWLKRDSIEDIANHFQIEVAPIVGNGTLHEMVALVEQGFKSQWGNFIAEGIVARPQVELFARDGSRIITKIKHKDFVKK